MGTGKKATNFVLQSDVMIAIGIVGIVLLLILPLPL